MANLDHPEGFYLGREYDLEHQKLQDRPVLYEPRDLTTHGVVVGMTGSGKTGLCISLLEEAALDGIPCIIVDLKGDLSNLLLNFPELQPEDFEPWIDPDVARRKEMSVGEYARDQAKEWRRGLKESGQSPARIRRLREAGDWRVYTPGSEAGRPVSVVQTFSAPRGELSRELLNDKVEATTTAILGLTRLDADPVQSREHILIANLLLNAWSEGRDLDLARLIAEVQAPPLRKIGTFDVDMFYPEEERLKLAVTLNNLLAAPSFSTWITGEPLNIANMLTSPEGKPRQLIFYLAHLDDSQRMFFLTLLLQELLTWTRSLPGSTQLRALVYIDEVFGYLPPHPANPPTKVPLMTLMKQARAFGVGVLLATQNPVDLDYKALTNAGTWFVGKLRTDRDKARLLEGLEGVAAEQGTLTDRGYLDTAISSLGNRVFLLHDVHRPEPLVFQTRWALSYLYGPLTREQLAQVCKARGLSGDAPPTAAPLPACQQCSRALPAGARFCPQCGALAAEPSTNGAASAPANQAPTHVPPVLPPDLVQYYVPLNGDVPADGEELVYQPMLLGFVEVKLTDRSRKVERKLTQRLIAPPPEPGRPMDWSAATEVGGDVDTALPRHENAFWADVPKTINDAKKLRDLERSLVRDRYEAGGPALFVNRSLDLLSEPGEDEAAFRDRCRQTAARLSEDDLHRALKSSPSAIERLQESWHKRAEDVKEVKLTPRKTDIRVTHFGLGWVPYWRPAGSAELRPAYQLPGAVATAALEPEPAAAGE